VTRHTGRMAKTFALDHIVLVVDDVERTLAWYQRHAGLDGVRIEEWRRGEVFFPSLRIDEQTIIDVLPRDPARVTGEPGQRNLDHVCFVVSAGDLATLGQDPDLEILDRGTRFGARGDGESIYVRDPDGMVVEFRTYDT
jgi:catechol 2,3-dioxygenase-like lactoylglutathione lyase family enzyme